jgi:hypothetical protein
MMSRFDPVDLRKLLPLLQRPPNEPQQTISRIVVSPDAAIEQLPSQQLS